jgi:hypothetical protein
MRTGRSRRSRAGSSVTDGLVVCLGGCFGEEVAGGVVDAGSAEAPLLIASGPDRQKAVRPF